MIVATAPLGLFGKIPSQGDFHQQDLPNSFVRPWDDWLSRSILASQAEIGVEWPQIYLLSPPWRFLLAPGVAGPSGWIGVLVASIDRVNRFYPLTLALPLAEELRPEFVSDWRPVYDKLESAAFALIDAVHPTEEILAGARREIADDMTLLARQRGQRFFWQEGQNTTAWVAIGEGGAMPQLPGVHLLAGLRGAPFSMWWHDFWEPHAAATLLCRGLPPVAGFAALLDAQWRGQNWRDGAASQ